MTTTITEIAPDIYRLSTFVDEANLTMNQFLVDGEEPLLFHTGQRALFTSASDALSTLITVRPPSRPPVCVTARPMP